MSAGMAGLNMVGLPETAVKESKDRVRSALTNTHFDFPVSKITVNLAPADLPKEGGRLICLSHWAYWQHPVSCQQKI